MKLENIRPIYQHRSMFTPRVPVRPPQDMATGTGVTVELKSRPQGVIKNNNPEDPVVSKKILDSLDLGLINFNQSERDAIAKIMSEKAAKLP